MWKVSKKKPHPSKWPGDGQCLASEVSFSQVFKLCSMLSTFHSWPKAPESNNRVVIKALARTTIILKLAQHEKVKLCNGSPLLLFYCCCQWLKSVNGKFSSVNLQQNGFFFRDAPNFTRVDHSANNIFLPAFSGKHEFAFLSGPISN